MMRVADNRSGLRVLIGIPVLYLGGTEIQTMTLIRALLSMNAQVTVCCYFDEYDDKMVAQMEEAGANVILMDMDRNNGLMNLFVKLFRLFRKMEPDAVHIRYIAPGLVPVIAARLAGISRIIVTAGQLGSPYGFFPRMFMRIASLIADCIICTSRSIEKSWFGSDAVYSASVAGSGRKHFTIYNSADACRVRSEVEHADAGKLKEQLGLSQNRIVAVVGRLREEKGHVVLFDAMKEVLKHMPDVVLLVIGDGPAAEALKNRAMINDVSENIRFLGVLHQKRIFQLFNVVEAVIVPSLQEGFGLVAVEAMSCGVPVVASRVGGLTELIEDGTSGLLFPPGDTDNLAKQMMRLLRDKELASKISRMSLLRVKELFSYESYRAQMVDLYERKLFLQSPDKPDNA